jgi:hypothetical protein
LWLFMQTLICSAEIREITLGLCVDGRAFVKPLDHPAAVKTGDVCKRCIGLVGRTPGHRWMLAHTVSVVQGICRMR